MSSVLCATPYPAYNLYSEVFLIFLYNERIENTYGKALMFKSKNNALVAVALNTTFHNCFDRAGSAITAVGPFGLFCNHCTFTLDEQFKQLA